MFYSEHIFLHRYPQKGLTNKEKKNEELQSPGKFKKV